MMNKKKPEHGRKIPKATVQKGAAAMSQAMSQRVHSTKKAKGQVNRKEKKI